MFDQVLAHYQKVEKHFFHLVLCSLLEILYTVHRVSCAVACLIPCAAFTLTPALTESMISPGFSGRVPCISLALPPLFLLCPGLKQDWSFYGSTLFSQVKEDLLHMKLLFCLLGLVLFVEGLPYVISPGKMKKWMLTLQGVPNSNLRAMGLFAMALGLLITYFFKE